MMNKITLLFATAVIIFMVGCGGSQKGEETQVSTDDVTMSHKNKVTGNSDLKINQESIVLPESGSYSSQSMSGSPTKWFKKTKNKCSICKSGNGCSGYWGTYHSNGTYEGACQNSDGWGHRCSHGPEKHGLKRW